LRNSSLYFLLKNEYTPTHWSGTLPIFLYKGELAGQLQLLLVRVCGQNNMSVCANGQ
jgi:hypothetical protein